MSKPLVTRSFKKVLKSSEDLRVTRSLRLRINEKGELRSSVSHSSGEFFISLEVVELLCLISRQRYANASKPQLSELLKQSIAKITKILPAEGEVQHLLEELEAVGIVVQEDSDAQRTTQQDGFGDPWIQWAMLTDKFRTQCYLKAIDQSVTENSIVLDVGSGTGLFAAAALNSGAKYVFSIEETASAQKIPDILKKLKINTKERFKIFAGNSSEASIPSGVNLVVSELFGNDPFQEGVLPTLRDIASRLPNLSKVNFIPQYMQIFAEIIDLKGSPIKNRIEGLLNFSQPETGKSTYEKFLTAAREVLDFSRVSFAYALEKSDFERVSKPLELGCVRLDPPESTQVKFKGKLKIAAQKNAKLPLCVIWFRAKIVEGITISSHPSEADTCEHWSPILIPLNFT